MKRKKLLRTVGVFLILGNLLLALLKTGTWIYTNSLSIQSEAVNSWIDTAYTTVVFVGIYLSTRNANKKYPEGHHRLEPFVSLIVGTAIIVTGIILANKAILSILSPTSDVEDIFLAIATLIVTTIVKYIMYLYTVRKEDDISSPLLTAIATDNRNDIITVLVAFIGLIGYRIGLTNLDAIAALTVSLTIAYSGADVLYENTGYILGRSVDKDERDIIIEVAKESEYVKGVHDVQIHYAGSKVDISMHLEVDGGITIERAHNIETEVGTKLKDTCSYPVNEVNLHVDPYTLEEWKDEE